ncbi:hypothetical protein [Nitrosomonas communis]|uniref:hypothetical protein n=1 Tax=Nitrosomonas communis TaxID=44574 RepID=UPI0026E99633|nr:hypothetical protein [Nitrosomonas communis]MCO6428423.1 hypothetical protein [Nitrosomonas communis]
MNQPISRTLSGCSDRSVTVRGELVEPPARMNIVFRQAQAEQLTMQTIRIAKQQKNIW